MKILETFHEARRREANRVISRYWHLVEQAHQYERRSRIETIKPARLLSKASTTGLLAQAVFGSKATVRLEYVIAVVAILVISFGAKMFFLSPPTADAGTHSILKSVPTAVAHGNARSMQIGEPPYP